jgi:[pyruvate, water dikinase]-phosphate phosphotransferase / [pyruvate, water dikinase] kinase
MTVQRHYFHLHLVSDSTGETLIAVSRAAAAQYETVSAIEHVYPLIRNATQLERIFTALQESPGIVLYTLVDQELAQKLEQACAEYGCPCLSVLDPVLGIFQAYLGLASTHRPGAQHVLNSDYFRRIDALNYTMMHDDGQQGQDLDAADIVLVGISRTSKTPTSIYLANRGLKTANVPLVPGIPLPMTLETLERPLVVGLVASPERISQIRHNRLLSLNADENSPYIDRNAIAEEIAFSRKLCQRNNWPMIDVTRRSIEETAAAVLDLYRNHLQKRDSYE